MLINVLLFGNGGSSFLFEILFTLDEAVEHVHDNLLVGRRDDTDSTNEGKNRYKRVLIFLFLVLCLDFLSRFFNSGLSSINHLITI
jgi:hypothetical protein